MQWGDQRDYIMKSWNVGWFLGTLFVITNLFGQLVPCGMILLRKKTDLACGILVFIIAFQVSQVEREPLDHILTVTHTYDHIIIDAVRTNRNSFCCYLPSVSTTFSCDYYWKSAWLHHYFERKRKLYEMEENNSLGKIPRFPRNDAYVLQSRNNIESQCHSFILWLCFRYINMLLFSCIFVVHCISDYTGTSFLA